LNEAANIGRCLASIHRHFPGGIDREVLVGDHGSTDGTPEVASQNGARVLCLRGGTVGELRNRVAAECSGSILIFLDADTTVTEEWGAGLAETLRELENNPRQLTGSMCLAPDSDSPFVRYWFARIDRVEPSYLGTGHLIVPAALFNEIGGFAPGLTSAEDRDFSIRARSAGAALVVRPHLRVFHHDYPVTAFAFTRRECWHGAGDFQSWHGFLKSPAAIATSLFLALHVAAIVTLPFGVSAFAGIEAATLLLALILSMIKFRNLHLRARIVNAGIFYLYLLGRTCSIFRRVWRSLRP
jgi:glycosyltransferase involved in cell wall biosynthesis